MAERPVRWILTVKDSKGPEVDRHTPIVESARQKLLRQGVPPAVFEERNLLIAGLTPPIWAKRLNVFAQEPSDSRIERILQLGVEQRHFPSVIAMSPKRFYTFLDYLLTSEGRKAVQQLAVADKLAKKAGSLFSVQEVAKVAMFNEQRTALASAGAELINAKDKEIAKLELRLRKKKAEKEETLKRLFSAFAPAGEYIPARDREFNILCWNEYLRNCEIQGVAHEPLTAAAVQTSTSAFAEEGRKRDVLNFLAFGERRQQLMEWTKEPAALGK